MQGRIVQVYTQGGVGYALGVATSPRDERYGVGSFVYLSDGRSGAIESGSYPNYVIKLDGPGLASKARTWTTDQARSVDQRQSQARQEKRASVIDNLWERATGDDSRKAGDSAFSAESFLRDNWKPIAVGAALVAGGAYLLLSDDDE